MAGRDTRRSRDSRSGRRRRVPEADPVDVTALAERSRGFCEGCGGMLRQTFHGRPEVHHRLLRSGGGTNAPANLLVLHARCHAWAHHFPEAAREAGWIVSRYADPGAVPVIRRQPPDSWRTL